MRRGAFIMTLTMLLAGAGCYRSPDADAGGGAVAATQPGTSAGESTDSRPASKFVGDRLPEPAVDLPGGQGERAEAVFAGGCFWCTEGVFEQVAGVIDAVSGYAGGAAGTANYGAVSTGSTGHAEAVRITYDPRRVTYGRLLRIFFATHNPTQLNAQGPDEGTQYRSAIFYANDEQKRVAQAYIDQLTAAHKFSRPIVTRLEPLDKFYPAEAYHQGYVRLHPNDPYIRQEAIPKLEKLRQKFPEELKEEE